LFERTIDGVMQRRAAVPVTWPAGELARGDPQRAANLLRDDPNPRWGGDWKPAVKLIRTLEVTGENVD
jgi:hypothetical protein